MTNTVGKDRWWITMRLMVTKMTYPATKTKRKKTGAKVTTMDTIAIEFPIEDRVSEWRAKLGIVSRGKGKPKLICPWCAYGSRLDRRQIGRASCRERV